MKRHFEDEYEEEFATFVKIKPGQRERAARSPRGPSQALARPARKASYESSADVQRWLREQAYEEKEEQSRAQAFNPSLLASRRDAPWILSSLTPLYEQHLITDLLHEAHSGEYVYGNRNGALSGLIRKKVRK